MKGNWGRYYPEGVNPSIGMLLPPPQRAGKRTNKRTKDLDKAYLVSFYEVESQAPQKDIQEH